MLVFERRIRPIGLLMAAMVFGLAGCMHRDHEVASQRTYGSLKDHVAVESPAKVIAAPPATPRPQMSGDGPRVLPPLRQSSPPQPAAVRAPEAKATATPTAAAETQAPRQLQPSGAAPVPAPSVVVPSAPSAPPTAPIPPVVDAVTVERLLVEGQRLFEAGKVLEARRRFIAAMNGPVPEVLLALARTYDTYYLSRLPAADAAPDMQRALVLYERAVERGAIEANADLERTRGILKVPR